MDEGYCPVCEQPVGRAAGRFGLTFLCPRGDGAAIGHAVFRKAVGEDQARGLWMAIDPGAASTTWPCPFCRVAMAEVPAPVAGGGTGGIGGCRRCEMWWVPAGVQLLGLAAPEAAPVALVAPCPTCGAPATPDDEGLCRYCHTALRPQVRVVEVDVPSPSPFRRGGVEGVLGGLIDGLLGF
jgi:hypothetical protein